MPYPQWPDIVAIISLATAFFCFLVIIVDLISHPQHVWIMNIVWRLTALYFGPLALFGYSEWGRLSSHRAMVQAKEQGIDLRQ